MPATDTVMFAIQAGLQIGGAARKAYVDATRGRAIVLPLPATAALDVTSAFSYFNNADDLIRERHPRGAELGTRANLTDDESVEILALYREVLAARKAEDDGVIGAEDMTALFVVRQWTDEQDPTLLQSVAGTIVNIAVGHFLEKPGAISDKRPEGRALRTFLEVLDTKDFATIEVQSIAPDLMVAVIDSVAANPEVFGGGDKEQALISNVTSTLAKSAQDLLKDKPTTELRDGSVWLQLTARAIVKGGADTVLANPQRFLGVKDDVAPLIATVGQSLADLVIGDNSVTLRPLLSQEGLDTIAKASLSAVAANPGVLGLRNSGLENIIVEVAKSVSGMREVLSKDIFPEVARLVLDKSADNLDLLWPSKDAKKHLLVTATKTMLQQITKGPEAGQKWRPRLTGGQVVVAVESVLDEVVDNPEWMIKRAGKSDPILGEAVKAILASLRGVDGKRFSADAGVAVLRAGMGAAAVQLRFLDELPGESRTAIQASLDAIFDVVFEEGAEAGAHWKLARNSALTALVQVALDELAESSLGVAAADTAAGIAELSTLVREELASPAPFDPQTFGDRLEERLAALA